MHVGLLLLIMHVCSISNIIMKPIIY